MTPRLYVKAEGVALGAVLDAIGRRTGVVIEGAQSLSEPVSVNLDGVGLDEAVARLVRGRSYILVAEGDRNAVARIVILRGARAPAPPSGDEPDGVANPKERLTVLADALAEPGSSREALLAMAVESRDPDVQPAALEVLGYLGTRESRLMVVNSAASADRSERLAALRVLATVEPGEALPLLGSALEDSDVAVRSAALELLATLGGEQPLRLLDRSLGDPDPAIRLAAVELLARRAGEDHLALVRKALNDRDEGVRQVAASLLDQAGKGGDEKTK